MTPGGQLTACERKGVWEAEEWGWNGGRSQRGSEI